MCCSNSFLLEQATREYQDHQTHPKKQRAIRPPKVPYNPHSDVPTDEPWSVSCINTKGFCLRHNVQ